MEEEKMKEMIERIKKTLPYLQNMKVREVEKNSITFISENGREIIELKKPCCHHEEEITYDYIVYEEVDVEIPKFILKISDSSINLLCKTASYEKTVYIKAKIDLFQYVLEFGLRNLANAFNFCKNLTEEEKNNGYLIVKKAIKYSEIPLDTVIDARVDESFEVENKKIVNYKEQGANYFLQFYHGVFYYAESNFRVRLDRDENLEFSICGKKNTLLKNEDVSVCLTSAFEKIDIISDKMCNIENSLWKRI